MTDDYDIIIVGSGAAGGIVAGVVAEAGKRVLLLERGRRMEYRDISRDHLRNHRLSLYGHNTGPDLEGNPRVFVEPNGQTRVVKPHQDGYNNNAVCVGGGTRVYGAQAWRFMPQDFQMATTYGCPEGSSLADWPITYEQLAADYERAEWEVGVAGDADGDPLVAPRRRGYPMPPIPDNPQRHILGRGAQALGWSSFPVPMLINTIPFNGRPACVQCGSCVGFACPNDSRNGTHNTFIPRALATGLCDLVPQAIAERIETDDRGNVVGLSYLIEGNGVIRRCTARAKVVVVSCGAIESARLLWNSASSAHPRGLGNHHDQLGRHLQGHHYVGAQALMGEQTYDGNGPGVSIATCQFNHGNPGVIGGGMLANEFIPIPAIFWRTNFPPDLPKWGLTNKRFMRENYTRFARLASPVQEIPSPDCRVCVDPAVRDKYGLPVARLSGMSHAETLRTADFIRAKAVQWLQASGAIRVWSYPSHMHLTAGQHQAGTCRMGNDPRTSVTDPWGRVHAHDNLYVVDASLHVTNGGFNPVLTIMALAFRCAVHLAKSMG